MRKLWKPTINTEQEFEWGKIKKNLLHLYNHRTGRDLFVGIFHEVETRMRT